MTEAMFLMAAAVGWTVYELTLDALQQRREMDARRRASGLTDDAVARILKR